MGKPKHFEKQRFELRLPVALVNRVDIYQEKNAIPTRTAAMLELLRRALDEARIP